MEWLDLCGFSKVQGHGEALVVSLADSSICSLEELNLSNVPEWWRSKAFCKSCNNFLKRQLRLNKLHLLNNSYSSGMTEQILASINESALYKSLSVINLKGSANFD